MKKTVSLFLVLFGLSATQAQSIPAEVHDLIQNQNSIQTAASDESFLIDGVVWSRPYGEKLYHLTPSVPNVLEYESKIRAEAELSDAGPNAAKFHFAELQINPEIRFKLKDFYIVVPEYVNQKVIVYLPLYQLNILSIQGVTIIDLPEYGKEQMPVNNSAEKNEKAVIWSEGFEINTIPGNYWNTAIASGATNCGWKDKSCYSRAGQWSAFCSGTCSDCEGYQNNMSAEFFNSSPIFTSGYSGLAFYYWIYLDLYNIGSNDEFRRYEKLGAGNWTLKATYTSTSSIDGAGWKELSIAYSGIFFPNWSTSFYFYSNSIGTSVGVYLDDLRLIGNSSSNLNQVNVANTLSVYPNPSNGQFEIQHESIDEFELLSSDGKLVLAGKVDQGKKTIKSNLDAGVYFVRGKLSTGEILTQKLIIH